MNRRIEKKVGRKILAILGEKLARNTIGSIFELKNNETVDIALSKNYNSKKGTPCCGGEYCHYVSEHDDTSTICYAMSDLLLWSFPRHPEGHKREFYPNVPASYRFTGKRLIEYARKLKAEEGEAQ